MNKIDLILVLTLFVMSWYTSKKNCFCFHFHTQTVQNKKVDTLSLEEMQNETIANASYS